MCIVRIWPGLVAASANWKLLQILQYQNQESRTNQTGEATAMLAGMIVSTRNFSLRTGPRTFDAASCRNLESLIHL